MKFFTIIIVLILTINLIGQNMDLPIIPVPKIINEGEGKFTLKENLKIINSEPKNEYSAELIQKALKDFLNINSTINKNGTGDIIIQIKSGIPEARMIGGEGYILKISKEGILIESSSNAGIHFGVMSLLQLLEKAEDKELPSIEVIDFPDMKVRGISDDISRGQVSTIDNFKKIISHISRYKMNTYMPYLEDMIKFDNYPSIGENRGALTKEEVKELVAFAKKNFVEVIPIFQTLGHYENILSKEEFLKYAEFPGAASLNVSSDSTYIFLENLLKEVFQLFPSEYFHMGADESWDVGLGASKHLVEETNIAVVHANHYKKVYEICKKYSKKVLMYGDIILDHPEILSLIPKDIIIVDWHYGANDSYPSTKIFKDAGFQYYVSPASWNFVTTFPTNSIALPNIKYFIKSGLENSSLGMINSNWGDYGAETFKEFILFDYAWSAQCSWNYEKSDLADFSEKYFYDFFAYSDVRIPGIYATLSNPFNQMLWHEVWRHPLIEFKKPAKWEMEVSPVERIEWMNWTLPQVEKNINDLKLKVKKNKDHFELLNFIVDLDEWYKLKLETQLTIHSLMDTSLTEDARTKTLNKIDENISSLKILQQQYRTLWLKYYKEANLNLIEDKFERMISYYTEIKDLLSSENKFYPPLIKSEWIYVKNTDSTYADKAVFKTEFQLSELPDEAYLQLMGDTYAKLFINDEYVDKVYARRSLSLSSEYLRIKFIDVKKNLKQGKNTIKVEVENFNRNGAAGVNISSYIKINNNIININTNDQSEGTIWKGTSIGSEIWKEVTVKPYQFQVIAPNFATKRSSWIER